MNTQRLIQLLDEYLQLLQQQNIDNDDKITELKLLIWNIEQDIKTQRWLNSLSVSDKYFRR